MNETNKKVVEKINAAMAAGDTETFLALCADDFEWLMAGGEPIQGKAAVRAFMAEGPSEPPSFTVDVLVADGDHVICVGEMTMDESGKVVGYSYCDVWQLRDGKAASLKVFAIKTERA
jgi:uncharacterized protein (TIGR02246 family)